ncbi:MAG TPA: RsmE family RNA methyltransferase [Puia sp.]|nr:RsmE family RNA methyltransferase [Puia sp.]
MALPFFYIASFDPQRAELVLDEDNSRHIVQVLRMQRGSPLQLTDGLGNLLTTTILDDHKKKCTVQILTVTRQPPRERNVSIAISLLKNASRFEWFLEKATEIGVTSIIPLLCERTERQHFRQDRLQNILVSAMLQSQQAWLPSMPTPTPLTELIENHGHDQLFIAHCLEEQKVALADAARSAAARPGQSEVSRSAAAGSNGTDSAPEASSPSRGSQLILIGPEGDFSPKEIELAIQHDFLPVTLGATRLRTETAGIVAATLLCIG